MITLNTSCDSCFSVNRASRCGMAVSETAYFCIALKQVPAVLLNHVANKNVIPCLSVALP